MRSLLWSWLFERKHLGYAFGLGGTETRPRITVHLVLVVRETIQRKRQNAASESTSTSFVLVQRKKLNGIKTEHLHHLFWFASLVLVELKRVHETPPNGNAITKRSLESPFVLVLCPVLVLVERKRDLNVSVLFLVHKTPFVLVQRKDVHKTPCLGLGLGSTETHSTSNENTRCPILKNTNRTHL